MISSTSNEQVKRVSKLIKKSKARNEEGVFVVEGIKMFEEISEEQFVEGFVSESFLKEQNIEAEDTVEISGKRCYVTTDSVYKKMSDTVTPQGILAVVKQAKYDLEEILENSGEKTTIIVLDRLQDPGNLGTIIRTSEAADVSAVVMSRDTVDVYNPKVIRSTMGSIYRVPFVIVDDLASAIDEIKGEGITVYAAHLDGVDLNEIQMADKRAIMIGNESKGLSKEIADKADQLVKIPMSGNVESLNAAIAAAVLMYK